MGRSRNSGYGYSRGRSVSSIDVATTLEEILVIIVILVCAAAIRLWKLSEWSFWEDEIFSIQDAQKFPGVFTINPVIYMVINFFIESLGISELSSRLGPCIIGIISVPGIYWVGKRMFNSKVAMVACLFLLVHPWHIYWSQNVRAYSLAFFLSSLSAASFYSGLERDSGKMIFVSLILTVLTILSFLQTILLLPAFFMYIVFLVLVPVGIPRGLHGKNLAIFFGPFFLALFSLLSPSIRGYISSGWGLNELARSPLYIIFTIAYGLGIPTAMAAFIGGIYSLSYLNRAGLFLLCYAIVPLFILLIISSFLNVAGYYLFFTMPAYILLAALCAVGVARLTSRTSFILSTSVILIVLLASISQTYFYFKMENGGRPKWREAFQTVKPKLDWNIKETTIVVAIPRVAEYYLKDDVHDESLPAEVSIMQLENVISGLSGLENTWRSNKTPVWFVIDQLSLDVHDPNQSFRKWLYANCQIIDEFPVFARTRDRTVRVWRLQI